MRTVLKKTILAAAGFAMLLAFSASGCGPRKADFPLVKLQTGRTADELTRPPVLRRTPTDTAETPETAVPETEEGPVPTGEEPPGGPPEIKVPKGGEGEVTGQRGEHGKLDKVIQPDRDLIKEAGFDMIYPNFNRQTGRRDPFVPVNATEIDWEPLKKLAGEQFRVIGTAMTPTGQIAMITVMEQVKVVREGDILENGSMVKSISPYDVVLDKEGRELRLTMFTRKRIARMDQEEDKLQVKKLDNINDLYKKYLEDKFGEEFEGREGEADRPGSFSSYMDTLNRAEKQESAGETGGWEEGQEQEQEQEQEQQEKSMDLMRR